jgi:membrane peptidoglycan carboxypeptidase
MNIRLPKLSRISSLRISTRAAIALTVAAVVTFESALFTTQYFAAARYLKENDPRKSANLTWPLVFARPKLFRRGQQLRLEQLIDHLTRIGYARREGSEPGTFQVIAHMLHFNSRLPEFPSATFTFDGPRLAGIAVDSRSLDQVEVEPEPLIPFMRMVSDERARMLNERRIVLSESELIPSILYDAVRASEDKRFESSSGIDEPGIARSVFTYLSGGFRTAGSGSGITQQLMKNSVLKDSDKTLDRKTREIFLSLAATRMMTRQEIFTAYANNVYVGHIENGPTLLGFEAAAREFFGKSVRDLSVAEAASLSGILDKPEVYLRAARNHDYSLLLTRRDRVLRLMHESFPERYSADTVSLANAEPIQFAFTSAGEPERSLDLTSKPFERLAAEELPNVLAREPQTGNLHIFTTIDPSTRRVSGSQRSTDSSRFDGRARAS